MHNISQLIFSTVFLVFMATSCMASTVENQAWSDEYVPQLLTRAIITGCVTTTITPAACDSSCTLTFYRAGNTYGVTLGGSRVTGVYGFTSLPGSIRFDSITVFSNGTVFAGSGSFSTVSTATITGGNGAQFFTTTSRLTTNTPIAITGAITASSSMTFGVSFIGGISTVTLASIINNAGVAVSMGRPGKGAVSVNLCAPK
jgi:hypothetical protein